jgi:pSer/pThr/pTyr-binding forkhead associated (FHA) protein
MASQGTLGMNATINRRELTFKSLAGLAGGALGWIPVEAASHGHTLTETPTTAAMLSSFISMAILSGLIGGLILASEEQSFDLTPLAGRRFLRGFAVCFLLSLPAIYYSNLAFGYILGAGGWLINQPGSMISLIIGRLVSWTLMGAMLGAGVGLAGFSLKNMIKGAAGGWIGGFIGGLAFDLLGAMAGGGFLARLFGLCAVGLLIGLFMGLVQELTKSAWLTVEAGRLRGRQYRLDRAISGVGRGEENPVGLFGDPAVQIRHAVIERRNSSYFLKNLAVQQGSFVNGTRVETVELHDKDRITIGDYELGFHLRAGSPEARPARPAPIVAPPAAASAERAAAPSAAANGAVDSTPCLVGANGERFRIRSGAMTRLGRALDNDVVIPHASVSRHHASIVATGGVFELHDLNSQNGTYVGGSRVTDARLADGDSVRLGEAAFTFHVTNGN